MSEEPRFRLVDPSDLEVRAPEWRVALAVEYAGGVGGICHDPAEDEHWLCAVLEHGDATLVRDEAASCGVGGTILSGGLVRPGVARVLARERGGAWVEGVVEDGVWLTVTGGRPLVFREEDAHGDVVRPPLPPRARIVGPVDDATDACIVCETVAWDLAEWSAPSVPPPHRDEDDVAGDGAAAICRTCGHQVPADGGYAGAVATAFPGEELAHDDPANDGAGDEGALPLTETEQAVWAMLPFSDARFPVYGLADWPGERRWDGHGFRTVGDEGEQAPEVTSIRLAHGSSDSEAPCDITIETRFEEAQESPDERLRVALEDRARSWLGRPVDCLGPALAVRFEREELMAGVAAELTLVEEITVPVDEAGYPFLLGRCAGGWVAYGVLDPGEDRADRCALTVTVTATDQPFAPFALAEVEDIAPYVRSGV